MEPSKNKNYYKGLLPKDYGKLDTDYVKGADGKRAHDANGDLIKTDSFKARLEQYKVDREVFYPSPATKQARKEADKKTDDDLKAKNPVAHFYSDNGTLASPSEETVEELLQEWWNQLKRDNIGLKNGIAVCKAIQVAFFDKERTGGWRHWRHHMKWYAEQRIVDHSRTPANLKEAAGKGQERLHKAANAHPMIIKATSACQNLAQELGKFSEELKKFSDEWTHNMAVRYHGQDSDYVRETRAGTLAKYSVWTDEWSAKRKLAAAPESQSLTDKLRNAMMALQDEEDSLQNPFHGALYWALDSYLIVNTSRSDNHCVFYGEHKSLFVDCGGCQTVHDASDLQQECMEEAKKYHEGEVVDEMESIKAESEGDKAETNETA